MGTSSSYQLVSFLSVFKLIELGNNYGLGETRKKELQGACKALGITREDRCVVLDNKYPPQPEYCLIPANSRTIQHYGGIRIWLPKPFQEELEDGILMQLSHSIMVVSVGILIIVLLQLE